MNFITKHIITCCLATLLSIVAANAQYDKEQDLYYCPMECETCKKGTDLLNNHIGLAESYEEIEEEVYTFIDECDIKHLVKFTTNIIGDIRSRQEKELMSGETSNYSGASRIMCHIADRLVSSHEIFTTMAMGRDSDFMGSWTNNYNEFGSYFILPYILEETCALIYDYEFNKAHNIRHDGYFYDGLRTYMEHHIYGSTLYMNNENPNTKSDLEQLLKAFHGYNDTIYAYYSKQDIENSACTAIQEILNIVQPNTLSNIYLYDKKLAKIYMDNAEALLRLAFYSLHAAYYYEIIGNYQKLFNISNRGDELGAIIEKLNREVFGEYGDIHNHLSYAIGTDISKLKSDHIQYTESLIAQGYEFAYYAPLHYPEELKPEEEDIYEEYCTKVCKLLSDMFGAYRLPSYSDIQSINRDLRSTQQFLDIDDDPLIYALELALTVYASNPIIAITALENIIPYTEVLGKFGSLYQLPYIAQVYCQLGNYDIADSIMDFCIIPSIQFYLNPPSSYEVTHNDVRYAVEGICTMAQLEEDYSDLMIELTDKIIPLFDIITYDNFGDGYEEERITLHIRIAEAMSGINPDKAKEQIDIALDMLDSLDIPEESAKNLTLYTDNVLLNLYYKTGDYHRCMEYYDRISPYIDSGLFIPNPDSYAKTTYIASQIGDYDLIDESARKYIDMIHYSISNTMVNLRSDAREKYWQNWSLSGKLIIDAYNTISAKYTTSALPCAIYDWNLVCKGLLLMANNLFDYRLSTHANNEVRELYNAYKSTSMALEQSYAKANNQGEIFMLQGTVRSLEDSLLKVLRREFEGGTLNNNLMITWQDVRDKLSDGEVAIEFMRLDSTETIEGDENPAKYIALLLRKEWDMPRIVELCDETTLSAYVSYGNQENRRLYNTIRSKELYAITWSRLNEYLNRGDVIYYATDGLLHQVNMESLRVKDVTEKVYADDIYDLRRLSSTRELCIDEHDDKYQRAVLFGNLNYHMGDKEVDEVDINNNNNDTYLISRTLGAGASNMVPRTEIPESAPLIHSVSDILQSANITTDKYTWNSGTENAFKQLSGTATDIILLYTHGFYMEGITEYQSNDTELSPMMRSGLVMAGSPDISLNSDNDGLLLAREIADMDLSCVDLVFLSACQTAQGEITSDGVFGIQRGLKQAGVDTIIMTLWEVNAVMSLYLVEEFYKALVVPGTTKREAFTIARNKARELYPNYDWAAYIMLD